MDINKVSLIGNLTADPIEYTESSGDKLVRCSMATSYIWKDFKTKEPKETISFHRLIADGKTGEVMAMYLKKGSRLYVEGRIEHGDIESNKVTNIIVSDVVMLGQKI